MPHPLDVSTVEPIGARIQALLRELNKNAAWLAEMVGVSRSTVTRIINGERNPTPETLQEMAPVLGVTLARLVVGTDAEGRVAEAEQFVPRKDYETAVHHVIEYERRANDLTGRVTELREELQHEAARSRRHRDELEKSERARVAAEDERDRAKRETERHARDAHRYRIALEKAVTDVALLKAQVRELAEAVDDGRSAGRAAAVLAGVAAVVSVASYLGDERPAPAASTKRRPPKSPTKHRSRRK